MTKYWISDFLWDCNKKIREASSYFKGESQVITYDKTRGSIELPLKLIKEGKANDISCFTFKGATPVRYIQRDGSAVSVEGIKKFNSLVNIHIKDSILWKNFMECIESVVFNFLPNTYSMSVKLAVSKEGYVYPYGFNLAIMGIEDYIGTAKWNPLPDESCVKGVITPAFLNTIGARSYVSSIRYYPKKTVLNIDFVNGDNFCLDFGNFTDYLFVDCNYKPIKNNMNKVEKRSFVTEYTNKFSQAFITAYKYPILKDEIEIKIDQGFKTICYISM